MKNFNRRRFLQQACASVGISAAGCATSSPPTDDKSNEHNNKTANSSSENAVVWRRSLDGTASTPTAEQDTVYVGGSGTLHAINGDDGTERWAVDTELPSLARPVVNQASAYVAPPPRSTASSEVQAVADGSVRWQFETNLEGGHTAIKLIPAAVDGGRLFIGGTDLSDETIRNEYAIALNTADGAEMWRTEVGDLNGIALDDERAFVTSSGGVYALAQSSGEVDWHVEGYEPTTPTVEGNLVMVGRNPMRARDVADGAERWRVEDAVTWYVASNAVIVGTSDGKLRALDITSGSERWSVDTGRLTGPPTVVDGVVYAATRSGSVLAVEAANGTEHWQTSVDGQVTGSPLVAGSVVTLYRPEVGDVLALESANGTEQWRFIAEDSLQPPVTIGNRIVVATGDRLYALSTTVTS